MLCVAFGHGDMIPKAFRCEVGDEVAFGVGWVQVEPGPIGRECPGTAGEYPTALAFMNVESLDVVIGTLYQLRQEMVEAGLPRRASAAAGPSR
jgi:hypothetical protein